MPGSTFTIFFTYDEATPWLHALSERLARPTGLYRSVGEYLKEFSIRRNFETETSPDGVPWARLSALTVARREAKGHMPIKILQSNSGSNQNLSGTIRYQVDNEGVQVGSNLPYANDMQAGAAQGAFGKTKRGGANSVGNDSRAPLSGAVRRGQAGNHPYRLRLAGVRDWWVSEARSGQIRRH